ncbi:MAG: hypothetical protein Tsb005_14150 [Gammaproteobacteria bacterium]
MASRAIGTFTRNTARQLNAAVSIEPRTGPLAAAIPPIPPHIPIALANSFLSVNVRLMMLSDAGIKKVAVIPWSMRNIDSTKISGDNPQASDVIKKPNNPMVKMYLAPKRSVRFPASNNKLAKLIV